MKKLRCILIGTIFCLFSGCGKNLNPIPKVYVDFDGCPNSVEWLDLNYDGGHMYFKGGVNGIVVYRISEFIGFSAFDRACPYDWEDREAYIVVEDDGIILKCRKCGTLYNILDGSVISGHSKYPLKQYYTKYDGVRLRIHS
jgi:nitrite reductase/ring-hydroxylating ferredoxin subunit